ncbi:MAG: GNAT family N-acetyltransferase [Candidatus Coatesbacteria bacterium]|nr:GNAT family N-acetyltransferase [Candidatus Coatesbacteria bacterium]
MAMLPTLRTERLVLRPFELTDALEVQRLAGDRQVAATTVNIPHPYKDGIAEAWIERHAEALDKGEAVHLAICLRDDGRLVGAIALFLRLEHNRAEIGYWVGKPYWGNGYCTEAAGEIIRYGFEELELSRIFAEYMAGNVASGRVLEKIGMKYEGRMRQHMIKWDLPQDMIVYGILKEDFAEMQRAAEQRH